LAIDNRDIKSDMGNSPPPAKKPTMEDTLIEMKMASKRMARESTKSMKESQQYMKKAKEALKKNN
jgi:charged multivesicular body protein 1